MGEVVSVQGAALYFSTFNSTCAHHRANHQVYPHKMDAFDEPQVLNSDTIETTPPPLQYGGFSHKR